MVAPEFRRGAHPTWFKMDRILYGWLDPWRADEVWRRLIQADPDLHGIKRSKVIAEVMGYALATSYKYRRAFEALGLAEITPGIQDIAPAIFHIKDPHPNAFADAYHDLCGMDLDLYVSSRGHDTRAYDPSVARSARSGRPAMVVLTRWSGDVVTGSLVDQNQEGDTTLNVLREVEHDTFNLVSPPTVAAHSVVLVKRLQSQAPSPDERSEEETSKPRLLSQKPLTAPDLANHWGVSPKTAYRRIGKAIEDGTLVKVGRGRYLSVDDCWVSSGGR